MAVKRSASFIGATVLAFVGLAGCAGTTEPSGDGAAEILTNEAALNVVAEVKLAGRTIKFLEPEPGVLLQVEKGLTSDEAVDPQEQKLSGAALYEYLARSPAPQALRDAEARATAGDQDHAADSVTQDTKPAESADKTYWTEFTSVSRTTFRNKFCVDTDRFYKRWDASGNTWLHTTGTNMMQAGAYSYTNLIDYHASYSGGALNIDVAIPGGWYFGWRITSSVNRTAHTEVNSAPSFKYDHCANYHY
jgi:hypothetical protein